jgi:hypothetical protein
MQSALPYRAASCKGVSPACDDDDDMRDKLLWLHRVGPHRCAHLILLVDGSSPM